MISRKLIAGLAVLMMAAPAAAADPAEKRRAYADAARDLIEERLVETAGSRIVARGDVYDVVAVDRVGRSYDAEALDFRVTARSAGARKSFYQTVVFIDEEPFALEEDFRLVRAI